MVPYEQSSKSVIGSDDVRGGKKAWVRKSIVKGEMDTAW